MSKRGLVERLQAGESVVVAEGYLFELEARGYLSAGAFVPEVAIENPDVLQTLYREFVHAGSDVVLAFTYYGHREKMRTLGREHELEKLNRQALRMAREVADETGTLMAGNVSDSTIYKDDPEVIKEIQGMVEEQVKWAVDEGADFIVGETYTSFHEALISLEAIKKFGVPAVITLNGFKELYGGMSIAEGCRRLEEAGAAVVGVNCGRGPRTVISLLKGVRQACKGPVATLPSGYRTDDEHINFQSLRDVDNPEKSAFPDGLDPHHESTAKFAEFTKEVHRIGYRYIGICCGNRSRYIRAMAEALGRHPPASRYRPNMQMHFSHMVDDRHAATGPVYRNINPAVYKEGQ